MSVNMDDAERGASLRLGKSLTNRINVALDQGIRPEDNKAILSFYLTPSFTLETEMGVQDSANNLSLKYNWDH